MLIQVMMSLGLTAVLALTMANLLNNQYKEVKALQESLAAMDLQKYLTATLANGSICKFVTQGKTFNYTLIQPGKPQVLTFNSLPVRALTGSPAAIQVGQSASAISNSLTVSNISLAIETQSATSFTGRWIVDFDNSKLVRALKPLSISTTIEADINIPSSSKIQSCMGDAKPPSVLDYKEQYNDQTASVYFTTDGSPFMVHASGTHGSSGIWGFELHITCGIWGSGGTPSSDKVGFSVNSYGGGPPQGSETVTGFSRFQFPAGKQIYCHAHDPTNNTVFNRIRIYATY
ncbi:hypothetical protein [Bdellovibrio bacteriovorus]|uniref:Uncharacterized protein n=1 Tax=Bdellovibrio bacteriovorus str. Tiberius TaxID=1069642 RepID=K7ZER8_BDEBC|nr:hypothetical protein [Bdellovibrio bacteriovorus]AFY00772.1 Hypothetical protein Bdt_1072 [Bdellovibrio bacteriovorus str. Tiberius]